MEGNLTALFALFMKKLKNFFSGKDALFLTIIFVAVIVVSLIKPSQNVKVDFDETSVDVLSAQYTMNIPYEMIESIQLTMIPEPGEIIDGDDNVSTRTGLWKNDTWGEHYLCLDEMTSNCVVVFLKDGRIFVFSNGSDEQTEESYKVFLAISQQTDESTGLFHQAVETVAFLLMNY